MPFANTATAQLRPDLVGTLEEFPDAQAQDGFIGNLVAPVIEVDEQKGEYAVTPREVFLNDPVTTRGPKGDYHRDEVEFDFKEYYCRENGLEGVIDDNLRARFRNLIDAETTVTRVKHYQVRKAAEIRVRNLAFSSTLFTGSALTHAASAVFTDHASAVPLDEVDLAREKVYQNSGLWANTVVMGQELWNEVIRCEQLLEAIQSQGAGNRTLPNDVTKELVANAFNLGPNGRVLVGGQPQNTANAGQTAALSSLWTKSKLLVCYIHPNAENDHSVPACLRTMHWGQDGSTIGGTIESYRDEKVRADVVRVRHDTDEQITALELGHLITSAA